jgi:hypothetical protein
MNTVHAPLVNDERALNHMAATLTAAGLNQEEVKNRLVRDGVEPVRAQKIATKSAYLQSLTKSEHDDRDGGDGRRNLILGGFLCLGGIVSAVISFNSAAPGGTYVIPTGAILGGGALFIKGLFDANSS